MSAQHAAEEAAQGTAAPQGADPAHPEVSNAETEADPPDYEAARAELREIVAQLESGGQPLAESLALWERGEYLAELCQHWLNGASARLDAAMAAGDPDAATTPDS